MSQSVLPQSQNPVSEVGSNSWLATRELPAWAVSLGLHTVVLVALALWSFPVLREKFEELIVSSEVEEAVEPEFKFDVAATDQVGTVAELRAELHP